jgi:hypothetical protein
MSHSVESPAVISSAAPPAEALSSVPSAPRVRSATPKPAASALLLATAAVLSFRATTRDHSGSALGVLVDNHGAPQHLAINADGAWALSSAQPLGQEPILLYESAANVLRGGALNPDGSIAYAGGSYVIEPSRDSKGKTAKVSGSA